MLALGLVLGTSYLKINLLEALFLLLSSIETPAA
jgi:hypothetical protein